MYIHYTIATTRSIKIIMSNRASKLMENKKFHRVKTSEEIYMYTFQYPYQPYSILTTTIHLVIVHASYYCHNTIYTCGHSSYIFN